MQEMKQFQRDLLDPKRRFTYIGAGSIGGKAQGLVFISEILDSKFVSGDPEALQVSIPASTVIRTGVFDAFLEQNDLRGLAESDAADDVIAHEFQRAHLPAEILGDLRGIASSVQIPLAVRSSSLLEDALHQPFAGVYMTKMIANVDPNPDERFRKLTEAIKLIYASVFFKNAKDSIRAAGRHPREEKMAVLIQEVVGTRFGDRYYPHVSGVARSFHFYATSRLRPEHGVVSLALGLGKTIVDGGMCWTYSPAFPTLPPPVSASELLDQSQTQFWAVNLAKPLEYDPIRETEYMVHAELQEAEHDQSLGMLASTYDAQSDRFVQGLTRRGPRMLDFSGLLRSREIPFNQAMQGLLRVCQEAFGAPVEIEFALTLHPNHLGFLQVRPMLVSSEEITIAAEDLRSDRAIVASAHALGNGARSDIRDIVYVRPDRYDPAHSAAIAAELESVNRKLLAQDRKFLLIGFGRWGSTDPWLGIPVNWGQISGAASIVEATQPGRPVDMSQGSHFFHNLMGFQVTYFSVTETDTAIRWEWLNRCAAEEETSYLRHIRLSAPLQVRVDGRTRTGVILMPQD